MFNDNFHYYPLIYIDMHLIVTKKLKVTDYSIQDTAETRRVCGKQNLPVPYEGIFRAIRQTLILELMK